MSVDIKEAIQEGVGIQLNSESLNRGHCYCIVFDKNG